MSFFGGHRPDTQSCLHCILSLPSRSDRVSKLHTQFTLVDDNGDHNDVDVDVVDEWGMIRHFGGLSLVHDWLSDIDMMQRHLSTRDPELIKNLVQELLDAGLLTFVVQVTCELVVVMSSDLHRSENVLDTTVAPSVFSAEEERRADMQHMHGEEEENRVVGVVDDEQSRRSLLVSSDNDENGSELPFKVIILAFQIVQTLFKEQFVVPEEIEQRERQLDELNNKFFVMFHDILQSFTEKNLGHTEILHVLFQALQTVVILSHKTGFVARYEEKCAQTVVELSRFLSFFASCTFSFEMNEETNKLISLVRNQALMAMIAVLPTALAERYAKRYAPIVPVIVQQMKESLNSRESEERNACLTHCAEILFLLLYFPLTMPVPYTDSVMRQWHGYIIASENDNLGSQLYTLLCEVRSIIPTQDPVALFRVEHYLMACLSNLSQLLSVLPSTFSHDDGPMIAETIMDVLYSNLDHDKEARRRGLFDVCIEKKALVVVRDRNDQQWHTVLMHPTFRESSLITIMNFYNKNEEVEAMFSPFVADWRKLGQLICQDMEQRAEQGIHPQWMMQFAWRAVPWDARKQEELSQKLHQV